VVAKIVTPAASAIAYAIDLGARLGMLFSTPCELTFPNELCNGADDSRRRRLPEATQRAVRGMSAAPAGDRQGGDRPGADTAFSNVLVMLRCLVLSLGDGNETERVRHRFR
jgi:hypothetical protein